MRRSEGDGDRPTGESRGRVNTTGRHGNRDDGGPAEDGRAGRACSSRRGCLVRKHGRRAEDVKRASAGAVWAVAQVGARLLQVEQRQRLPTYLVRVHVRRGGAAAEQVMLVLLGQQLRLRRVVRRRRRHVGR